MIKRLFADYIQDIIESIDDIQSFIIDYEFEKFSTDKKTINAVVRSVEVLGEASKKIPESTRAQYPEIPWKKMAGMRNKLIHEYFGVDLEILWKVSRDDLPPLKPVFVKILEELDKESSE